MSTEPKTLFEKVWEQHVVVEPKGEPTAALHRPATGARGHFAAGI